MEFLNTLYESEYFVYIVGGAIGVLLILFLIILFSGKKKKEADPKETELLNEVTEKSVIADATPVKDNSLDATKEFKPEDLATLQTKMAPKPEVEPMVMSTPVLEPEVPVYNPVEPISPVEPIRPIEPVVPPMDSLVNSEVNNEYPKEVELTPLVNEVKPVNPEPMAPTPEEKISFQVAEENGLPKLNTEDKEL